MHLRQVLKNVWIFCCLCCPPCLTSVEQEWLHIGVEDTELNSHADSSRCPDVFEYDIKQPKNKLLASTIALWSIKQTALIHISLTLFFCRTKLSWWALMGFINTEVLKFLCGVYIQSSCLFFQIEPFASMLNCSNTALIQFSLLSRVDEVTFSTSVHQKRTVGHVSAFFAPLNVMWNDKLAF